MFHGRSANEVALPSAAIVLALVQRLEKKGTLRREESTFTNDEDTSNFQITATGKFDADTDTVNFAVVYTLQ